jgi:FkbM family methyltransferase
VTVGRAITGRAARSTRAVTAASWRRLPPGLCRPHPRVRRLDAKLTAVAGVPLVTASMRGGHRLLLDLRSGTEWFAYYSGRYNESLIAAARRLLQRPGCVAIDAGANVGFWTIPLAVTAARVGGRVVAVEPVPANAARLRENVALNGLGAVVDIAEVALSRTEGPATLTLREDFRNGARTGNAAIAIDDDLDASFEHLSTRAVPLDTLLQELAVDRVDFIKADVEGHEDLLLAGAQGTIERSRPVIVAEWNRVYYERRGVRPDEVLGRQLIPLDYVCLRGLRRGWMVTSSFESPKPVDDVFFAPRERAAKLAGMLNANP